ncbi:MAG: oxidoreductase, zinc-binding dehydrogenase family [Acidobacteriaceae bacterium]|nr:oxidoreductase, zinc-binding dehydrogenase family [Acidobacteriaceae bacterium]
MNASGYAAHSNTTPLKPYSFTRRDPQPKDVVIDIEYCGVCHSDIHQVRGEWGGSIFPMVPGHEIVGTVSAVGKEVTRFKPGDLAAVGVMVDSCRKCSSCKSGLEQYCEVGMVGTYGAKDRYGDITYGGYSDVIVTDEHFVYSISPTLNKAAVAPLLCAGITTYSPLKHWGAGPGKKVGVVGLGGLGHMGLKFAHSLGAHVVQFTTSLSKTEDAKRLGADEVVLSTNANAIAKQGASFDMILDTVSAQHDLAPYLSMLKLDGTLVMVGLPEKPMALPIFSMVIPRRAVAGSAIGGVPETQEMLDYCAEHNIVSDVEVIPIQKINEAFERVLKSDVKYRFVIDMASLKNEKG